MPSAAGADLGALPAEQAFPARKPQLLPVHLPAVRAQHVHIKQPPHGGKVLQFRRNGLYGQGFCVYQKNTLVSGFLPDLFKMGHIQPGDLQLPPQQPLAQSIAAADQGAVFDGPRYIHGKADHGLPAAQQLPLPHGPLLPGLQHFHK